MVVKSYELLAGTCNLTIILIKIYSHLRWKHSHTPLADITSHSFLSSVADHTCQSKFFITQQYKSSMCFYEKSWFYSILPLRQQWETYDAKYPEHMNADTNTSSNFIVCAFIAKMVLCMTGIDLKDKWKARERDGGRSDEISAAPNLCLCYFTITSS